MYYSSKPNIVETNIISFTAIRITQYCNTYNKLICLLHTFKNQQTIAANSFQTISCYSSIIRPGWTNVTVLLTSLDYVTEYSCHSTNKQNTTGWNILAFYISLSLTMLTLENISLVQNVSPQIFSSTLCVWRWRGRRTLVVPHSLWGRWLNKRSQKQHINLPIMVTFGSVEVTLNYF